jgi:hypothetical protein
MSGDTAFMGRPLNGDALDAYEAADAELWWPLLGAVNLEEGFAVQLERVPRRQWRRSYCSRSIEVSVPRYYKVCSSFGKSWVDNVCASASNRHNVIQQLWTQEYPEPNASMQRVFDSDVLSVALSRNVVVACGKENLVVYYRGKQLGRVNREFEFFPALTSRAVKKVNELLGTALMEAR